MIDRYMSIFNQAERLRHALRNTQSAKKYLDGNFNQASEDCLEMVYEDLDNAIRKITAALIPLDELLDEMDPDEEEETADRYTLAGSN